MKTNLGLALCLMPSLFILLPVLGQEVSDTGQRPAENRAEPLRARKPQVSEESPSTENSKSPQASPVAPQERMATLLEFARQRSLQPFQALETELPEALTKLDYDGYRSIRFPKENRVWFGSEHGFQLEPMHMGGLFRVPVELTLWNQSGPAPLAFASDLFHYDGWDSAPPPSPGFSGFRLRHALNIPEVFDEFLVFQGASYFRGVGRGHRYGTSARGLALGTASPNGEEFPAFTHFWFEEPQPASTEVVLVGLLEGPSVVGLARISTIPGRETMNQVELTLFPRVDLKEVGIAPLTSMFLYDGSARAGFDDLRPAVHDAHGLQMIHGSGERLWRPLANPANLEVSSFMDEGPKGFGLAQRRREFRDYEDNEARYELRPSAWIEPLENWGPGAVMLVEIPLQTEFNDNIVTFWRPRDPLVAGQEHRFRYRLRWCDHAPDEAELARVVDTRCGRAPNDGRRLIAIDFDAGRCAFEGTPKLEAETHAGEIVAARIERLPEANLWRATLEFEPGEARVAEMSVQLYSGEEARSERWLYRWTR